MSRYITVWTSQDYRAGRDVCPVFTQNFHPLFERKLDMSLPPQYNNSKRIRASRRYTNEDDLFQRWMNYENATVSFYSNVPPFTKRPRSEHEAAHDIKI